MALFWEGGPFGVLIEGHSRRGLIHGYTEGQCALCGTHSHPRWTKRPVVEGLGLGGVKADPPQPGTGGLISPSGPRLVSFPYSPGFRFHFLSLFFHFFFITKVT